MLELSTIDVALAGDGDRFACLSGTFPSAADRLEPVPVASSIQNGTDATLRGEIPRRAHIDICDEGALRDNTESTHMRKQMLTDVCPNLPSDVVRARRW